MYLAVCEEAIGGYGCYGTGKTIDEACAALYAEYKRLSKLRHGLRVEHRSFEELDEWYGVMVKDLTKPAGLWRD